MPIRKWFEKFLAPARTRPIRRAPAAAPRARMGVEALECRVVPSTFTESESPMNNNSAAQANVVTIATGDVLTTAPADWLTINGTITGGDVDFFRFTLTNRSGVFFDIDSRESNTVGVPPLSLTLDSTLALFTGAGAPIAGATNDDGYDFEGFSAPGGSTGNATSRDSSLYVDLMPGTYAIRVGSNAGSVGQYQLRMLADSNYSTSVPALNSRPGASDTFYMDFDGHNSTTDAWTAGNGPYTATPFDFNSNAGEFSPAERLAIRSIWSIVSEDFAPYNINISTVDPGMFPDGVAFRHVITNSGGGIVGAGGVLGIAFLNSYASGGPDDSIAFTFASDFGDFGGGISGEIMAKSIERGNTTSHEFGHALGLNHYRSSNDPMDPSPADVVPNGIMATPDMGLNRERFASGINESGAPQVDSSIIGSISGAGNNTFGLVADDHGDLITTATALIPIGAGTSYTGTGLIRQESDIDYFSFVVGGSTTISVDVDNFSANLNATLRLFDANGVQIGIDAPTNNSTFPDRDTLVDATITTNLANGTYFIAVSNSGLVGDVGRYTVNITTSITLAPVVVTTAGTTPWIKDGPPVVVDGALTLTDLDDTILRQATVRIAAGYAQGQDVLALDNGFGVLSFFDVATGTLTLFGTATVAQYQTALRNVTYNNTALNPTTGDRTLTFQADDDNLTGAGAFKTVSVSVAPVLNASAGTTTFTEGAGPAAVDPAVTVADADSANLTSAVAAITGGFVSGDLLVFADQNGITGSYNATTGVLTLTGMSSVANYQAALQSIAFDVGTGVGQTPDNPTAGTRVVTFSITDGIAFGPAVTKTVGVLPVNDAPTNTVPAGPLSTAEDVARALTGLSVADPDAGTNAVRVTLSVTAGTITVNTALMGGLTPAQVSGNGTGTVVLTAPLAAINASLATGPTYTPAPDANGPDTLTVTTSDLGGGGGTPLTAVDTVPLTVTAVNDDPVAVADLLSAITANSGPRTIPFATLLGNDRPGPANESAQSLSIVGVAGAVGGTVAIVGGAVEFTPTANFTGIASFFYTIQDDGTTNGAADPKTGTGQVSFTVGAAPVSPPPPAAPAPAPTDATPFYTSAAVVGGTTLVLRGAGVPGGEVLIPVPAGTTALFTDLSGDGKGDLILITPALALVADGATGRFLALATDVTGDGVRDLLIFNPDGTTTRTDGRTGVSMVM